jgi:hypothetical protein
MELFYQHIEAEKHGTTLSADCTVHCMHKTLFIVAEALKTSSDSELGPMTLSRQPFRETVPLIWGNLKRCFVEKHGEK